jgi:hypothetical protein
MGIGGSSLRFEAAGGGSYAAQRLRMTEAVSSFTPLPPIPPRFLHEQIQAKREYLSVLG